MNFEERVSPRPQSAGTQRAAPRGCPRPRQPRPGQVGRRANCRGASGDWGGGESCADLPFLSLAGYYLTTWFGALHHIAHYQPEAGRAPQGLSSEARASLRQWHSRRTLHRQGGPGAQVTARPHRRGRGGLHLLPS